MSDTETARKKQLPNWLPAVLGSGNVLVLHAMTIDLVDGDHTAALLIEQLIYWSTRSKGQYVVKSEADWHSELRLTPRMVRRIRAKWGRDERKTKEAGDELFSFTRRRSAFYDGQPAYHYRLNPEAINKRVATLLDKTSTRQVDETSSTEVDETSSPYTEPTPEPTHTLNGANAPLAPSPNGRNPSPKPKRARKPPTPRGELDKRDVLYETVELRVYGIEGGDDQPYDWNSRAGIVTKWLRGEIAKWKDRTFGKISAPAQPQHVEQFLKWYTRKHPGQEPPKGIPTFVEYWRKFGSEMRNKPAAGSSDWVTFA